MVTLIADQRRGSRLGVAIANTWTSAVTYELTVYGVSGGAAIGIYTVSIPGLSNLARFVDDMVPTSAGRLSTVTIRVLNSLPLPVHAIGLRFTGAAFTTVPATVRLP